MTAIEALDKAIVNVAAWRKTCERYEYVDPIFVTQCIEQGLIELKAEAEKA